MVLSNYKSQIYWNCTIHYEGGGAALRNLWGFSSPAKTRTPALRSESEES